MRGLRLRGEDLYNAAKMRTAHRHHYERGLCSVRPLRYRPELVNYERRSVAMVRAVPFGTGFIDYPAFFPA